MWRVWNMRRMTRKRRGRDMKLRSSQRLMDMKKQHWEFCSQYCQTHVLSVTDPSDQELNSVPQALGNVSSEIAKQSLPHAKKLKGTVKPSIGGRLNEFFFLDKDREDIEVTSIRANDFAYAPAGSRDFSGSIPLSADEVYGTHQLMERQRSYRKETTRGLG